MSLFIRLSTQVLTDAKIISAGPEATVLWIKGMLYAKEHLTDGIVPTDALPLISIGIKDLDAAIKRLIQIDLWSQCAEGYTVGSERWARHQTTKAEVETMRAANRERKRKSRERYQNASQNGHAVTHAPEPEPEPEHRVQSQSTEPEVKHKSLTAPSSQDAAPPALFRPLDPWISMPTNRPGESMPVFETDIEKWCRIYPAVDVQQELRNMFGWLDANPRDRKTLTGMPRFINAWLKKEQDRGGGRRNGSGNGQQQTFAERKLTNTVNGTNGAVAMLEDRARTRDAGTGITRGRVAGTAGAHGH